MLSLWLSQVRGRKSALQIGGDECEGYQYILCPPQVRVLNQRPGSLRVVCSNLAVPRTVLF